MDFIAQYPNAITQTALAALTLATIDNFSSTLTYKVPQPVGETIPTNPLDPAPRLYIMRTITVKASTINQDLVEFQSHLRENNAYL